MNCTKCGAELAPESKFCVVCGTPAAQPAVTAPVETAAPAAQAVATAEAPAAEKEGFKIDVGEVKEQLVSTVKPVWEKVKPFLSNKKVLLGIGIVVLVLIIASVISIIASGSNGFIQVKQYIQPFAADGEIRIVVDKKVLSDTVEAESLNDYASSMDGKIAAFLTSEDELYVVNGKKLKKVAEDVFKFELAVSGKGIAYVVKEDDEYTLNLYTVGNGKSKTITDELGSLSYVIAPDGKSVAYYVEGDEDEDKLMFSKGSDPVKITSSETDLVGMSNGGKYIYVITKNDDNEMQLCSYDTKGERTKLGTVSSDSFRYNDDHTQIMFYNEGKTYISTKAKEPVKASSDRLSLVIAPNASSFYGNDGTTYPVSDLYNHVYSASDGDTTSLWMVKKNSDKTHKLVSKVSNVQMDESAKYLYYIYDGEELRMIKISDGEKASERYVELAEDVEAYIVTSDRKYVYYYSDDSLYSINGKKGGKSTVVCNDEIEGLAINGKDVVYYIMDGDLYATNNGKKGSKVLSDVSSVMDTQHGFVYAANEDTIYVSNGSKKPSKLMDRD